MKRGGHFMKKQTKILLAALVTASLAGGGSVG